MLTILYGTNNANFLIGDHKTITFLIVYKNAIGSICWGFVVQQFTQQSHNKLNQWSSSISVQE